MAQPWQKLVLGGTVLTMEEGAEPIAEGAVAIADGKIAAVGPAEELLDEAPTGEMVDASGCLVLPGLVNTHSHLGMTLLRGFADDLELMDWLENHIWPVEGRAMDAETVRLGTELAVAEQLRAGVTTTTDMYFFGRQVGEVLAEAGMRGLITEPVIDFPTPSCSSVDEMLDGIRELAESFRSHPLVVPSAAAHAPYSVSAANLVRVAELADELGLPLQIHISETRTEVERILEDKGVSPVAYLADLGVLGERTVAAHCVHLAQEDIDTLGEFEVGISHNPVSNLKLASGVAPVPQMLAAGLDVGLGTDGAASNNTLDLLRDMQLTTLLHKGVSGDATCLPARAMVEMATCGGARVLGLDHRIGRLVPGFEADLICIANDGPHAIPVYDPFSHLVYAARSSDVRHVLVRGRAVIRNGSPQTLDMERIAARAREQARRIASG